MSKAPQTEPRGRSLSPSRLGVSLALLHCALLVHFAATRPNIGPPLTKAEVPANAVYNNPYDSPSLSVIAGREFSFSYEPLLLKIVYLLDIPAHLFTVGFSYVAIAAGAGPYLRSWIGGLSWLILGAAQWLWVGSIITSRRRSYGRRYIAGVLASVPIGIVCGAFAGAAANLLGEVAAATSGVRLDTDFFSTPALLWLVLSGAIAGGTVGAAVVPLSYLTPLHQVGFRRAFVPAILCTTVLGAFGVLLSPLLGIPASVVGYFLALVFLAEDPDAFNRAHKAQPGAT